MIILFILHVIFCLASGKVDYNKCMEISTFGYNYDAVHILPGASSQEDTYLNFMVKASSNAHVLLTNNPEVLDKFSIRGALNKGPSFVEVLLGGGQNTFSEIRAGTWAKRYSKTHVSTPDILSSSEYRAFWINITKAGYITAGRGGEKEAILSVDPFPSNVWRANYFALSSWNNVKGHWKFNCPQDDNSATEFDNLEETNFTGAVKLKRDLIMFYDPNIQPEGLADKMAEGVLFTMQIHHIKLYEKKSQVEVGGRIRLSWLDKKLVWTPADFDNITSFLVSPLDIWTPDLRVLLSSTTQSFIQPQSAGVLVQSNGLAMWNPMFVFTSLIELQLRDWPNDVHNFTVHLSHNTLLPYSGSVPNYIAQGKNYWEDLSLSSEWQIVKLDFPPPFPDRLFLALEFTVKRTDTSYFIILSTPFIVIAILTLTSFWMQPDNRGKLYLNCISIIITSFFLIDLAERIPVFTEQIPGVVKLYLSGLLLSCLSILHYVVARNMESWTWTIPYCCSKLLTNPLLNNIFCLQSENEEDMSIYRNLVATTDKRTLNQQWLQVSTILERIVFVTFLVTYLAIVTLYQYL